MTQSPTASVAARAMRLGLLGVLVLTGCGLQAGAPEQTSYGDGLPRPPARLEGLGGPQRPDGSAGEAVRQQRRQTVSLPEATTFTSPRRLGFIWPVGAAARITSDFGWRRDPFTGSQRFHHGLDIACWPGERISAAGRGQVVWSGPARIYGTTVVLAHRYGVLTVYAHLQRAGIEVGDRVAAGEAVGACGSTGRSTGPHLHLEVRHGNSVYDPVSFLP